MSFQALMEKLKKEYFENLPAKISQLETNCQAGAVEKLQDDFHKLKGTGKTYGFPEITEVAAAVEKLCQKQSPESLEAAHLGVALLKEIHARRAEAQDMDLSQDDRFLKITRWAA